MGGHTHYGEYGTPIEAVKALQELRKEYEVDLGLFLTAATITYNDESVLWRLEVRFSK